MGDDFSLLLMGECVVESADILVIELHHLLEKLIVNGTVPVKTVVTTCLGMVLGHGTGPRRSGRDSPCCGWTGPDSDWR